MQTPKTFDSFHILWRSFDYESLIASFFFSFSDSSGDIFFTETISFRDRWHAVRWGIESDVIDTLLFHLSIALAISYYKLAPTSHIYIETWSLSPEQIAFWEKFYRNGLGEYLYTNQIDPEWLFQFISSDDISYEMQDISLADRHLIPVWWWKDSCVTIERYKQQQADITLFSFGKDYAVHRDVAEVAGLERIFVSRQIDSLLIEMNKQWYHNGHVPITGIISFILLVVGYLYDYKHLVMSNEKSADFGNVERKGYTINHQYSKSHEYEQDFMNYVRRSISPEFNYYSELSDIYDAQVAEEMCQHSHYFPIFSSCNRNFHIDTTKRTTIDSWSWRRCCTCPKCLFTYITMRPYLTAEDVSTIWGYELLEDDSIQPLLRELLWEEWIKPFECVGTPEEVREALEKIVL